LNDVSLKREFTETIQVHAKIQSFVSNSHTGLVYPTFNNSSINLEGKTLLNYKENNINYQNIHNYQLMSEEGGSINEKADFSSGEEEVTPTEPEAVPEPEVEIISSVREEGGIEEEAATEETIRGPGEPIETSADEQTQLSLETKSKKQTTKTTIVKIQTSLADASKQIENQMTQINKISQNLQSLQKQLKSEQRQSELVNQIRSQVNQIQKQVSQVQKGVQKRTSNKLRSNKKMASNKKKTKKGRLTRQSIRDPILKH